MTNIVLIVVISIISSIITLIIGIKMHKSNNTEVINSELFYLKKNGVNLHKIPELDLIPFDEIYVNKVETKRFGTKISTKYELEVLNYEDDDEDYFCL